MHHNISTNQNTQMNQQRYCSVFHDSSPLGLEKEPSEQKSPGSGTFSLSTSRKRPPSKLSKKSPLLQSLSAPASIANYAKLLGSWQLYFPGHGQRLLHLLKALATATE
ncbi:hypothetical protein FKM82_028884 [Ascaphus truei]